MQNADAWANFALTCPLSPRVGRHLEGLLVDGRGEGRPYPEADHHGHVEELVVQHRLQDVDGDEERHVEVALPLLLAARHEADQQAEDVGAGLKILNSTLRVFCNS